MTDQINSSSYPAEDNEGIHPKILSIRLSQESECWEDMTNKVIEYLQFQRAIKLKMKEEGVSRLELEKQELEKDKPKISR